MKIGVQTRGILEKLGLDEGMRVISGAGFETLDYNINTELPYDAIASENTSSLFDRSVEEIRDAMQILKQSADRHGLTIGQMHAPYPTYIGKPVADEYLLQATMKCIPACAELGCRHLVVHPAFLRYEIALSPEQEREINLERFSRLIPWLKEYDVICCLENMFVNYKVGRGRKIIGASCSDPHEAADYIDTLNRMAGEKRFAFCFDTGHALLLGMDVKRAMGILGERIECLHLHDNNGAEDQHLAPYMGMMDWENVIEGLRQIHYQGNLSFETFNTLEVFAGALMPECLRLICASGELFRKKLMQND